MRHVAFLRAVNVGGRVVKMDRLRALFEGLGLETVSTFIASGNVIFETTRKGDPAALERRIETRLREELGYEVATFLRDPAELATIAALRPFPEGEEYVALSIAFLKAAPDAAARERLLALRTPSDDLRLHGRELYWGSRTRTSESKLTAAAMERALGGPATVRNVTTVRKLAEKYAGGA